MEQITNSIQNFYAHGKLLISGEYLVIRGAKALAVPLNFGQSLQIVSANGEPKLIWRANFTGNKWFEATFNTSDFEIQETDNFELACRLRNMLQHARIMGPLFLAQPAMITATSSLGFPPEWGIGSGSSLMANIGRWAKIDPFELNHRIFGGSGYDVAAALSDKPIVYNLDNGLPVYGSIDFSPSFAPNLYFVYLNRKQNSKNAVQNFTNTAVSEATIEAISEISMKMALTDSFDEFSSLMEKHEQIISDVIQQKTVKKQCFPDYKGCIKSLGAWGGDFVLAASDLGNEYVTKYFTQKGFPTLFVWDEIVLGKR